MKKIIILFGFLICSVYLFCSCLKPTPPASETSSVYMSVPDDVKNNVGTATFYATKSSSINTNASDPCVIGTQIDIKNLDTSVVLQRECFPYNLFKVRLWASDVYASNDNVWYEGSITKKTQIPQDNVLTLPITLKQVNINPNYPSAPQQIDIKVFASVLEESGPSNQNRNQKPTSPSSPSDYSTVSFKTVLYTTNPTILSNIQTNGSIYAKTFKNSDINREKLNSEYVDANFKKDLDSFCNAGYNQVRNNSTFSYQNSSGYFWIVSSYQNAPSDISKWQIGSESIIFCKKATSSGLFSPKG